MKTIIAVISYFLIAQSAFTQNNCNRTTNFGQAEICIPILDGMQECYLEPTIKMLADATEVSTNVVLAYYLDQSTYDQLDNIYNIHYDNYLKIYATKELQDIEMGISEVEEMNKVLADNFIITEWDDIKKEVDGLNLDIEIGQPTVVKNYTHNDKSFTYVMLVNYVLDTETNYTMAMTVNGMLLNKRLIWMAYYLNYDGEDSIELLQSKSNAILDNIIRANK